jgi:hypothetical protein
MLSTVRLDADCTSAGCGLCVYADQADSLAKSTHFTAKHTRLNCHTCAYTIASYDHADIVANSHSYANRHRTATGVDLQD